MCFLFAASSLPNERFFSVQNVFDAGGRLKKDSTEKISPLQISDLETDSLRFEHNLHDLVDVVDIFQKWQLELF